ncbi:ankyrin repeat protein [Fusarium flagelliforme]|uniref:Ankyrin repeat protein n=1 Tax=Fusarium flagelliforme TaxID=2675880 RepID=A0A395N1K3_9HYPO|nr:ankyrin repeat protein [Fusarium flagelliforme]
MFHHQRWAGIIVLFLICPGQADDFDDFTNNLFTDLAPIIALFGERVTTQFLSQILGWADCIALAMAPLGIITILISTIRVGGPLWLKAVVGRAKENVSDVEIELMSSTSREVCDLYNGTSIVRSQGTAPVWEYICLFPKGPAGSPPNKDSGLRFMTLNQAVKDGLLEEITSPQKKTSSQREKASPKSHGPSSNSRATTTSLSRKKVLRNRFLSFRGVSSKAGESVDTEQGTSHGPSDNLPVQNDSEALEDSIQAEMRTETKPILTVIHDTSFDAPNISLNMQNTHNRTWIRLVATIGIILQSAVMIFFGLMTHPSFQSRFQRDDKPVATHAAPMAITGTGFLVLGMIICGHVIESSTVKTSYRTTEKFEIWMYWVQQEQTVADRVFNSFATNPSTPRSVITMSRRKQGHVKVLGFNIIRIETTVGVVIGLIGFVVQFIGLRAMNSWATLAQLIAIAIMTFLRAIVRPGFTKSFEKAKLLPDFELDWLAWEIVRMARGEERPSNNSNADTTAASTAVISMEASDPRKQYISPGSWMVRTGGSVRYNPFAEIYTTPSQNSEAHDIMTMRRGLCRLAGLHSETTSIALNLALAIEKAMNILFPLEKEPKNYRWYLDVNHGRACRPNQSKQQVWFDICHNGDSWKVLADNFDACLSLWSYTIKQRKPPSRDEDQREGDVWLRKRRPETCLRLLGSKSRLLSLDLQWWASQDTGTIIEVSIGEYEPGTTKKSPQTLRSTIVDSSRIVGYGAIVGPARSEIRGLHTVVAAPSDFYHHDDSIPNSFALKTRDSLIELYAKDLLFSFMCSAANTLEGPILGKTELRPVGTKLFPISNYYLWNQNLSELAEAFCELGFGNQQEASIGIVSSLSMAQKLPFPQALFDKVSSETIKSIDSYHDFYDFDDRLWQLQRLAVKHENSNTGIWERYLALEVELLKETRTRIDLIQMENSMPIPLGLQKIFEKLRHSVSKLKDRNLLNYLSYLYKKQSRQMLEGEPLELLTPKKPLRFPTSLHLTKLHHTTMCKADIKNLDLNDMPYLRLEYVVKQDICNWTALHYASAEGDKIFITALLSKYIDDKNVILNVRDFRGYTMLHCACEQDNEEIALMLIRRGASLEAQGWNGVTPTHLAARHTDLVLFRAMQMLTAKDKFIENSDSTVDYNGRLPIHWAVMGGKVLNLIPFPRQLNAVDKFGWTPIHLAVVYNQLEVMDKLLELSADTGKKDEAEAGADCNIAANDGRTALHEAAGLQPKEVTLSREKGRKDFPYEEDYGTGIELVKFLVSRQLDPYRKDNEGRTPIDIAEKEGHKAVLDYLCKPDSRGSQTRLTDYWAKV